MTTPPRGSSEAEHWTQRQQWVSDAGPHALIRQQRLANGVLVLALAVRPGSPTNKLTGITLRLRNGDATLDHAIPVFPLYHHQWTLDLTAGVALPPAATGSWTGELDLTDAAGTSTLPLQVADPAALKLGSLSAFAAQPWSLARPEPER